MPFESDLIDLLKATLPALYWLVISGSITLIGAMIYLYFDRILDLTGQYWSYRKEKKE